ncbi:glycoside hydrolase family 2 TIM barrel-domain containing protein [uncultured Ferrovibrio sp.]|jgi:hypothetical protein|uniref:glycoside hydrolase family 2 TIM barrel-domain containing protein n=1 Tax=uncultured Ferrovibrio sp. TaxID=1576913 RepID=UPI0026172A6E|nr:glycoside hydrolase family 2 TIM barrel-domain containing protein [uncultured Ferrovibrio sp.]
MPHILANTFRSAVLSLALLSLACASGAAAQAAEVTIQGERILVDGRPFTIQGVAGQGRLGLLRQLGATTIRTYGDETGYVLDEAQKHGLKVIAGFWMEHPRRGFNYTDLAQTGPQLQKLTEFVERFRDHPALLMWGIGNEVEAELTDDSQVWPAIEEAARIVRRLDPKHPTMAVLAETGTDKIVKLRRHAPSIQVLGINSYGDALLTVGERARAQGWKGPLVITEMGPKGQWEAPRTDWGAPIEPSSGEKAVLLARYLHALKSTTQGQIVFYWGQKQEVTPTWHSLLLQSGEWQRTAEVMASAWGGATPNRNQAPRIENFQFVQGNEWNRDATARAEITVSDPDGDPLGVVWTVMAESAEQRKFGDAEQVPPAFPQAIRDPSPKGVGIAGLQPGHYRLFVTVRDGKGAAATANLPFRVK